MKPPRKVHGAIDAPALTVAEILKIGETDPKAADAALQRMKLAREAREAAGIVDPPDDWFGDLEVGAGETGGEVIGSLGALDASAEDAAPAKAEPGAVAPAEDSEPAKAEPEPAVVEPPGELDAAGLQAVEGAIAVAEAYEVQPDKPVTNLTVAIQKYRARTLASDCKEFGVDPTDPMAEQKVKVARTVKKFKATLADLEAYCPDFWSLPLKTIPKEGKKSRAWVLKNFKWRRYDEVTSTERTKLEDDKRQKKREAKIAAKGWPANWYELTRAERKTYTNRTGQQARRKRLRAATV